MYRHNGVKPHRPHHYDDTWCIKTGCGWRRKCRSVDEEPISHDRATVWMDSSSSSLLSSSSEEFKNVEDDDHEYVLLLINFLHCKCLWKSPSTSSGAFTICSQSHRSAIELGVTRRPVAVGTSRRELHKKKNREWIIFRNSCINTNCAWVLVWRNSLTKKEIWEGIWCLRLTAPKSPICRSCLVKSYTRPDSLKRHKRTCTKALPEATGTQYRMFQVLYLFIFFR